MAVSLNTGFTLPNGMRLEFGRFDFNDDDQILTVPFELRTGTPSGRRYICGGMLRIRNGDCSLLSRNTNPEPGLDISNPTHYFVQSSRVVATGYTDAKAAERAAANTPGARRTANEAHLYSAGHIDSSLAGT